MSVSPALRPAVFLDRDGTLNRQVVRDGKPYPPASLAEFELFPGVPEACRALHAAGYVLVVATNQPDVGRGDQGQGLDHPANYRRKPEPGMITDAATVLGLDLSRSWMVGDRWRDIDSGKRAGLRTVFIDFGYAEDLRESPDFTVTDFSAAAAAILQHP